MFSRYLSSPEAATPLLTFWLLSFSFRWHDRSNRTYYHGLNGYRTPIERKIWSRSLQYSPEVNIAKLVSPKSWFFSFNQWPVAQNTGKSRSLIAPAQSLACWNFGRDISMWSSLVLTDFVTGNIKRVFETWHKPEEDSCWYDCVLWTLNRLVFWNVLAKSICTAVKGYY